MDQNLIDQLYEQRDEIQALKSKIAELERELSEAKLQASNYAYQMDLAKRERDKAEHESIRLESQLSEAREREDKFAADFAEWISNLGYNLPYADKTIELVALFRSSLTSNRASENI